MAGLRINNDVPGIMRTRRESDYVDAAAISFHSD
jgi:hypothetical protein